MVGTGAILAYMQSGNLKLTGSETESTQLKPWVALLAGGLVGFGTRMAGGCTSGHGICGLPRLSLRSLSAVGTFMATGAVSALAAANPSIYPMLHRAAGDYLAPRTGDWERLAPTLAAVCAAILMFRDRWLGEDAKGGDSWRVHAVSAACAALFASGLHISGMTQPSKLISFLNPWAPGGWDPSMMGVMGAGVGINLLTFRLLSQVQSKPLLAHELASSEQTGPLTACVPMGTCQQNMNVDFKLIVGAAIFGLGWGLAGVCPGPSLVSAAQGDAVNAWVLPGIIAGIVGYELALA